MAGFLLFQPQNGRNPSYNAPGQRSNSAIYNARPMVIRAISAQILSHEAATKRLDVLSLCVIAVDFLFIDAAGLVFLGKHLIHILDKMAMERLRSPFLFAVKQLYHRKCYR